MVRQVRKILSCVLVSLVLITAFCGSVQAATHEVYDNGSLSTTYITYFKDILSGCDFRDNYVAFRSGQYSYTLVVGELEYENGSFSLLSSGKEYIFSSTGNYNSQYTYQVKDISNFSLDSGNSIIYADVGDFPQLIERGSKYETLNTILISIALLCIVISRIFCHR